MIASECSIEAARRFAGHEKLDMTLRYVYLLDQQYDEQILRAMAS